ncbi:MAG: ThiF family adenylyltransferase [Candidatus Thermoplasmatota archaeon]|nr:ThiF family adenylyltransferase [Candidatus Thermoplasmatota archaeon]
MKTQFRHELLDGWNKDKVRATTVLIGGIGATGSQAVVTLARIGVGKIIVIDKDVLEEHNIGNQVYRRSQIGKTKVNALKEIIAEFSDTNIIGVTAKVQDVEFDYFDPDVFFGNFDNHGARFALNYEAIISGKPYIDVGIENYTGTLRFVLPGKTSCMECWPALMKETERRVGCSEQVIPTAYFVASYAANLQVAELLNHLFGKETHPLLYFDLQQGKTSPVWLEHNPGCKLCSK